MDWQKDPTQDSYTFSDGICLCLVWHSRGATWTASWSRDNLVRVHENFQALADAQAWCLTHRTAQRSPVSAAIQQLMATA